jgi:hypothetical protein
MLLFLGKIFFTRDRDLVFIESRPFQSRTPETRFRVCEHTVTTHFPLFSSVPGSYSSPSAIVPATDSLSPRHWYLPLSATGQNQNIRDIIASVSDDNGTLCPCVSDRIRP